MDILEVSKAIHQNAVNKGFWEDGWNLSERLMLIVSEIAEAQEADRRGDSHPQKDRLDYLLQLDPKSGEFQDSVKFGIKNSFGDEMADVIIRTLDLCYKMDIPIEQHIALKMKYNETREYKHGKKY